MGASTWNLTDPDVQNLCKVVYKEPSDNYWQSKVWFSNQVKKTYDNEGVQIERPVPMGLTGGIGYGELPTYNSKSVKKATFTRQKMYAKTEVDRMSIKVATDKGAFVNGLKYHIQEGIKGFTFLNEVTWMGSGDGALGTIESVTDNGSGSFSLVVSAATWIEAHFEPNLVVNVGATDAKFSISSITPSTRTIVVARMTGNTVPAAADKITFQGASIGVPYGLRWACDNSGSKYGIPVGFRWQSVVINAASQNIDVEILDDLITQAETAYLAPTHLMMHYEQCRRLRATLEGNKRYTMTPTKTAVKGPLAAKMSFSDFTFDGPNGEITIHPTRFCYKHEVIGVVLPDLELVYTPGGASWVNEDGNVWSKLADPKDGFYANYAAYVQAYMPPVSVCRIHTLAAS